MIVANPSGRVNAIPMRSGIGLTHQLGWKVYAVLADYTALFHLGIQPVHDSSMPPNTPPIGTMMCFDQPMDFRLDEHAGRSVGAMNFDSASGVADGRPADNKWPFGVMLGLSIFPIADVNCHDAYKSFGSEIFASTGR